MTGTTLQSLKNIVVAIPCYNSQATIGETIQNVLAQTHRDFRILVYDDGSTDASPDIVKALGKGDSRVMLHRNDVNLGRPKARNALVGLVSDAIVAWQDADDLWHPSKLAKQVSFYEEMHRECGHERMVLVSPLERRPPRGGSSNDQYLSKVLDQGYYGVLNPPHRYDVNFICSSQYMSFPFYLQSTFGRASHFIDAGGFDPQLPWYEDLDMGIRLLGNGVQIFGVKSDCALAYYYSGAPSLPPDVVARCLQKIYDNNQTFLAKSGVDIQHDVVLRKLTLLFLGMIRKKEFGIALDILTQNSSFALSHTGLRDLFISNIGLLQKALRVSASMDGVRQKHPQSISVSL
jgi:glycosyltransferase involved in cell wall biosynthesis